MCRAVIEVPLKEQKVTANTFQMVDIDINNQGKVLSVKASDCKPRRGTALNVLLVTIYRERKLQGTWLFDEDGNRIT